MIKIEVKSVIFMDSDAWIKMIYFFHKQQFYSHGEKMDFNVVAFPAVMNLKSMSLDILRKFVNILEIVLFRSVYNHYQHRGTTDKLYERK